MILYAITDRRLSAGGDLVQQASTLLRAGVDWLQVREKDLPDRTLFDVLRILVQESRRFGTRILLNGRSDLASAAGAHGVHLPSDGLPTESIRRVFPRPFLVVRSCHSESEVMEASAAGADAVTLGPVYETPSKNPFGRPLGVERFAEVCRKAPLPVLALGGVSAARIGEVAAAGAEGVAAIRLFCGLSNPFLAIPALRALAKKEGEKCP